MARCLRPLVVSLALLASLTVARAAGDVAVEVKNESEPVLCAEKDNVTIKVVSPEVRRFQIEAAHPAYVAGLVRDTLRYDRGTPIGGLIMLARPAR